MVADWASGQAGHGWEGQADIKQAVSPVSVSSRQVVRTVADRQTVSMAEEYYRTGDRDFVLGHIQEAMAKLQAGCQFLSH